MPHLRQIQKLCSPYNLSKYLRFSKEKEWDRALPHSSTPWNLNPSLLHPGVRLLRPNTGGGKGMHGPSTVHGKILQEQYGKPSYVKFLKE
jgi:hypothetical protein